MATLNIYRGIPASGKTTAALEWIAEDPENRARVNRDDIRFMTFGKYHDVDEGYVTKVQAELLTTAMKAQRDIVLDNTNLHAKHLKPILALAAKWGYGVEFRDFPVDLHVALQRDLEREKFVGPKVIQSFYDRYTRNGKFPPIPEVAPPAVFPKHVWTPGLPVAIIVDLDGTLAIHNGRSPYDDSKIHTDLVDRTVQSIVGWHYDQGTVIVFMSGRDEGRARAETVKWLVNNDVDYYDHLIMRPAGDKRNDAVVKNELFETHVAGKYNVLFCLDDRNRVVDMWRAKGIKCLQVAEGDF